METTAKTAEWHARRRTGIGGSDAAPACGLSKWMTPLELYNQKLGLSEPGPETEAMRWGTLMEPGIRQEYANRTGRSVTVPKWMRHSKYEFVVGNVDGIADGGRLLEIKTSRTSEFWGAPGSDEIPDEYLLQVQHYLLLTGMAVCDVAVLFAGQQFDLYHVEADHEVHDMLIDLEAKFWERVKKQDPPEPISLEDMRRRWPRSTSRRVVATAEIELAHADLLLAKQRKDAAESEEEELKAVIQGFMQDADTLALPSGRVLATWKTSKESEKFDLSAFRAAHPDLFQQFLKKSAGNRPFLPKATRE